MGSQLRQVNDFSFLRTTSDPLQSCVFEDIDGAAVIDFSKFHELVVAEEDADHSGVLPSQI